MSPKVPGRDQHSTVSSDFSGFPEPRSQSHATPAHIFATKTVTAYIRDKPIDAQSRSATYFKAHFIWRKLD